MLNLAVFFGGRSCEHDVSIVTGLQAMEYADPQAYRLIPIYIARDGAWYTGAPLRELSFFQHFDPSAKGVFRVSLCPEGGAEGVFVITAKAGGLFSGPKQQPLSVDAALLCMHGMNGEDGALQGMLQMLGVPYTSAGVLGSAVGMDKILMKAVFQAHGFPVLPGVAVGHKRWNDAPEQVADELEGKLTYPMFVKPANLGSSIGISRATDRASLRQAMEVAYHYDSRVLVEQGVESPMEINCSVLGIGGDCEASLCEQPVSWQEFLTFEEKYLGGGKGGPAKGAGTKGMQSQARRIPAPINEVQTKHVQKLSCEIFEALDCKGVVRIDFMIDTANNTLYVNEINTIPGSLAFYLWEPKGMPYAKLIDRLVEIALAAKMERDAHIYAFDSNLLSTAKLGGGAKGAKGVK